jgi:hypothetical protein
MSFKRNQVEEAIARISVANYQKPPSELRTRIKRLLDLDRSMGRKLRSNNPVGWSPTLQTHRETNTATTP